ncbi:MAG: MFS transporter [Rubrivivax sp.]
MAASAPPAPDSPAAWRALAGAGMVAVFGVPALFGSTFGLFMVPFEQTLGWKRADIAFSLTLTMAVSWLSVLIAGWVADHLRLRPLLVAGLLLGGANLAGYAFVGPSIWQFYALVVAMAFTTIGASPIVLAKLVQGWFDKRLGIALGLAFACGAVGGVLHPLVVTAVIQSSGWRQAFLVMAAMHVVGGLLAVLLLVREPPAAARTAAPAAQGAKAPMLAFLSRRDWWTLALWNLLFAFGSGCIMVHFAALLHDRGVAPTLIGVAASVVGASHFAGNLVAGWLVDRLSPQRMAWLLMTMPLASALLMLAGSTYGALVMAAAVLGLASGSDGSLSAFLARFYFGGRLYGQASGTQMLASGIGGSLAPWLSGLMRDSTGDYQLSLTCAAVSFAAAVAAGWLLPRQGHDEAAEAQPLGAAGQPAG